MLIMDMYAGVEHLGRATVDFVDAMLVVIEPTRRSMGTALQIKKLANDIGLSQLFLVGNKVRDEAEAEFIKTTIPQIPYLGCLPADLAVQEADRLNIPVYDHVPSLKNAAQEILTSLMGKTNRITSYNVCYTKLLRSLFIRKSSVFSNKIILCPYKIDNILTITLIKNCKG